jgi:hypothetical protein
MIIIITTTIWTLREENIIWNYLQSDRYAATYLTDICPTVFTEGETGVYTAVYSPSGPARTSFEYWCVCLYMYQEQERTSCVCDQLTGYRWYRRLWELVHQLRTRATGSRGGRTGRLVVGFVPSSSWFPSCSTDAVIGTACRSSWLVCSETEGITLQRWSFPKKRDNKRTGLVCSQREGYRYFCRKLVSFDNRVRLAYCIYIFTLLARKQRCMYVLTSHALMKVYLKNIIPI